VIPATSSTANGDRWIVTLDGTPIEPAATGSSLENLRTAVAGAIDNNADYRALVLGDEIRIVRIATTDIDIDTEVIRPIATATTSKIKTLTLSGSANAGDTWIITVEGTAYPMLISSTSDAADAAANWVINTTLPSGYHARAVGAEIQITRINNNDFSLAFAVTASPDIAGATISGTPKLNWTQQINLLPAGPDNQVLPGDQWQITVPGQSGSPATVTAAAGNTISNVATRLAAELAIMFDTTVTTSADGKVITISRNDGNFLSFAGVRQTRLLAAADGSGAFAKVGNPDPFYLAAQFDIIGEYVPGETWTVTIEIGRAHV